MTEVYGYGPYNNVKQCIVDTLSPFCIRLSSLLDLTYDILFNAMRIHQNMITKTMEKELLGLATDGEKFQYIINGICALLVAIALIVIIPVFSWVIRDKSYVLAIFSDIDNEEIEQIISECKSLDLRRIRFKKKWISKYENKPLEFWTKVRKNASENNKGPHIKQKKRKSVIDFGSQVKSTNEKIDENIPKNEVIAESSNVDSKNTPQNDATIIIKVDKKAEKRILLSEIEYFSY